VVVLGCREGREFDDERQANGWMGWDGLCCVVLCCVVLCWKLCVDIVNARTPKSEW